VIAMTTAHEQAGNRVASAPSLVIALDRLGTGRGACRVEAPARVLRMWTVLTATDRELRQLPVLSPAALPRLHRSLQVVRTELTRSVSAPLAAELCDLLPPQPASPSMDELRIECASLLGWTGGLVLEILDQIQLAAAVTALAARAGAEPGTLVPAAA
jgi:hypothetical protein